MRLWRAFKSSLLRVWLPALAILVSLEVRAVTAAVDHFVILLYHHVSDDTPPSTSVSPQRFAEHLDWLVQQDYQVWPLQRALQALDEGELPDRVVVISFDDAYASVHTTAWPLLRARALPFSVFINSDAIDAGHRPYMRWAELRELAEAGIELGNHSASHAHLSRKLADESEDQWLERVAEDIDRAHRRIELETGQTPQVFAWPFGEDAAELYPLLAERYRYGLAQRSGAVGRFSESMALPRFPLAHGWDSIERLRLAVGARPLPVRAAETDPPRRRAEVTDPVELQLLLSSESGYSADRLQCYSGSGQTLATRVQRESTGPRLQVGLAGVGRPGRNKVNCTAPARDGSGDFFWHSFQWLQPRADGSWPAD
ncbi:MAG: polysaccharide deacetylase [Gammaproteobacteria bacterium HGW-Gammaproteobacteria-8]|nr:MAG: polysaccharide deacetylase [Gammaproteobacteria bacterium HGW-Gammaproteobacteria-8]